MRPTAAKQPHFQRNRLNIAVQACCYTMLGVLPLANAAPTGGEVVGGSGAISQSGTNTTINQATQNLAINWQSFDVAANERVQFIQPNASAIALNRILSNNGTTIAGRIDSNGKVILVNANGILFTSTSVLNVGSIIASGLDINPAAFMNGNYVFNELPGTSGAVINNGMINASLGGNVALIGRRVENNGLIVANLGTVSLAAGKQAVLTFDSGGLLGVRVSQEILQNELGVDPAVLNSGEIQAQGGRVLLTASQSQDVFSRAVNNAGMEPATSAVVNDDGTFTLGGADVLNSGSINTSATAAGQSGGRIVLIGENVTSSGTLRADAANGHGGEIELHAKNMTLLTGNSITSARSEANGNGGIVKVLGDKVGLFDQSTVDVSGANGGGQALIGGDFQGKNANIRNASTTIINPEASVYADALQNGNGGKVIAWSDGNTFFLGNISVRGGSISGDGGFVETSGKQNLLFDGVVDRTAANGMNGTLLLDPQDLTICGTPSVSCGGQNAQLNGGIFSFDEGITNSSITAASLQTALGSGSVTLQATRDVTFNANVTMALTNNNSLTVQAGDDIIVNNSISLGSGALILSAGVASCAPLASCTFNTGEISIGNNINAGGVTLSAVGNIDIQGAISTNGGNFLATSTNGSFINSGHDDYRIDTSGTGTGNVTISAVSASLGGITTTGAGSLSVTSTGDTISQSTDSQRNLIIGGTSRFDATTGAGGSGLTAIDLQNGANDLQGAVTLITAGTNNHATLVNQNATTTLGAVNVTGILTVTAERHLTLSGNVTTLNTMNLFFGDSNLDSTFTTASGITFNAAGAKNVTGGDGNDTFIINSMFNGTVNGGQGTDTLQGPGAGVLAANWQLNGFSGGTGTSGNLSQGSSLNFNGMDNLKGGDGVDNFTVNADLTGYIDGGGVAGAPFGSLDTVNFSGLVTPITVQLLTVAPVTVTNPTGTYTLYNVGSIVGNNGQYNTLSLTASSGTNQWDITGGNSGAVNGTTFSGFGRLVGGGGADTFDFSSTGGLTNNSGFGPVTNGRIDGGGGTNTLIVNGDTALLSTTTLVGSTLGNGNFSVIDNINSVASGVDYFGITNITANGGVSTTASNVNITGTLRFANTTGAVTSTGSVQTGTLEFDGVGLVGAAASRFGTTASNLSVLNSGPVYLNKTGTGTLNLGPIIATGTTNLIDLTTGGAVSNSGGALVSTSLLKISSAGNINLDGAGNNLSNIDLVITGAFGSPGNVTIVNTGPVTANVVTQGGNINFTNSGTITFRTLDANGGGRDRNAANYGGTINVTITGGSLLAANTGVPSASNPVLIAENFTGIMLDGDFGQPNYPISVMVRDLFSVNARGAYYIYGTPPPRDPQVNAPLSLSFDSIGFNRLLELDSLGEFDPAIFSEIRNYYYEDIAIMMPADQRLDGTDEEEKEKEEKL